MNQLLHIDSSVQRDQSISRRLTARAVQRWSDAHPGGVVTHRDLATDPIPHLDGATAMALLLPADTLTPARQTSLALTIELIDEIKRADTIVLGLPLYNFGPPSTVKAWVDHIVAPGLSFDAESGSGLLGDTEFVVLESRGGGYGPGTPHEGWDHAESWLPHAVSMTGMTPRFITAELTLAGSNPAMAELKPLAAESLNRAFEAIDGLWGAGETAA